MSLGGGFSKAGNGRFVSLINRVFNYAKQKGMTIVVAAGNESTDLDHVGNLYKTYCDAPHVVCVSATGPTNATNVGPWQNVDAFASYSNYGRSAISVAAPGGNASFVTAACSRTSLLYTVCATGNYVLGSNGTSMATPHVSGLAALLVEDFGRNPARIRAKIQQSADDLGQPGTDPYYGKGRINVKTALGL
jgi:subtilisin family serine protease